MIRKTIIGLLLLATLGTVALWAFAFFGGPYTTDWELTDRVWCMLVLSPERCEVHIVQFPPMPESPDPSTAANRPRAATLDIEKQYLRFVLSQALLVQSPIMSKSSGFGWGHRDEAARADAVIFMNGRRYRTNVLVFSERYLRCPSWALLILAGLLGAYPGVVFIRRPFCRARRLRNGWCLACGYDMQGNVSGVCPECGTSAEKDA